MATFTRDQVTGAVRGANGRFTSAAGAQLRKSARYGLSRSEQAPFAAAIIALGLILGFFALVSVLGSILSGILPQLGGGIAIGVLLGYLAMGRRPSRRDAETRAIIIRDGSDALERR